MLDRPTADRTAFLLLWFFRQPSRYQTEVRRRDAPALDPEVILKLALGRSVDFTDPELGAPDTAATLKDAAASYVRQVFFCPDATPYETLGLAPGASEAAIKESFRLLMQLVHPDRQEAQEHWPESFAAQANRAYGILRNRDSREKFDREAHARAAEARAAYRAAAASAPSTMPVVQRPRAGNRGSGPLSGAVLPEWLTAGVGGFAREHPAVVAFAVLIVGAAAIIGTTFREGREDALIRDAREAAAAPVVAKATPAPTNPAASVASADESGAQGGLRSKTRAPVAEDVRDSADTPVAEPTTSTGAASPVLRSRVESEKSVQLASVTPPVTVAPASAPANTRAAMGSGPAPAGGGPATTVAPPPPVIATAPTTPTVPAPVRTEPVAPTAMPPATPQVRTEPVAPTAMPPVAPPVRTEPVAPTAMPPVAPTVRTEPVAPAAMPPVAPAVRAEPAAPAPMPPAPPATAEIEALFAAFVESYEKGHVDAFAALFDDDADTNLRHGRAAIRGEYDELFRLSDWRRMQLTRVNWRRAGDRTYAKGEIAVRIAWRDGREVEQRLAVDMELVRRDGRVVIAKLSHQPKNP